jgi:glucokinase
VAAFEQRLTGGTHRPVASVEMAQLGNDAGLIGAADLARRR